MPYVFYIRVKCHVILTFSFWHSNYILWLIVGICFNFEDRLGILLLAFRLSAGEGRKMVQFPSIDISYGWMALASARCRGDEVKQCRKPQEA